MTSGRRPVWPSPPPSTLTLCRRRIVSLERELEREQTARIAADRNSRQFHALMLQARVALINAGKDTR